MSSTKPMPIYPGGMAGILKSRDIRRKPMSFAKGEALPPLDTDLVPLTVARVPQPDKDPFCKMSRKSDNHRKLLSLRAELAGSSELCVLHGLLVAHLRKRAHPPDTAALFQRLWAEQADHLLSELNARWLVSAITTFGDQGATPVQRQVGASMSALFGMMKLYENERRYSGHRSDAPFPLTRRRSMPLAMDMDAFSIVSGGLDVNLIGNIWEQAEGCSVIRPLAHKLLDDLIHDPYTVFRRLRKMRARLERLRKAKAETQKSATQVKDAPRTKQPTPPDQDKAA